MRDKKEWRYGFSTATSNLYLFIFHSMLNHPVEERRCNQCKGNDCFEALQIGDLLLCV